MASPNHTEENGYASSMLEEALNRLNKMGIHKVLMTCHPYNYASQKVIKTWRI